MLQEIIKYKEGLPVDVVVADIEEYPDHFHKDLEIIYTLEGQVILNTGHCAYNLKSGDIFVVNRHEIHSLRSDGEANMVMMLSLDHGYFSRYYEELKDIYFVSELDGKEERHSVIRSLLGMIMREFLQKGVGYEQKIIETAHNLISTLISDSEHYGTGADPEAMTGGRVIAGRINRITDYMYENYDRKLTLSEIADREGLSIYYLSHVIKEYTGLSFQDLLSYIRVEQSEKLLLETNRKIGSIALESGFSAVRYYIKHFRIWHGMHPEEYRKKYAGGKDVSESRAAYERVAPQRIEETIKKHDRETCAGIEKKSAPVPEIIDVELNAPSTREDREAYEELDSFLERENLRFIARPLNLIKSLQERVAAAGPNYIITVHERYRGEITGLSILVYNFDEQVRERFINSGGEEEDYAIVRTYDRDVEFLIRCRGISGDFNISRYLLTRDNMEVAYAASGSEDRSNSQREKLLSNWKTLPSLDFGRLTVSDTLSLSITLRGLSTELILIDRA